MSVHGVAMSRFTRPKQAPPPAGTPIWVWLVYAAGLLAASVILLSLAFSAVVYMSSDEGAEFDLNVSVPALVVWVAIALVAAGTLAWRRRRGPR